ncbi:MAG: ATP-dependent Clp protease adapter ClpS [Alphaproteobacteria bacterium]|nr:ATP-dependent Clp protease adapter ClpS [Alphaproteobacteria bacterium]
MAKKPLKQEQPWEGVATKPKIKKPSLYKVIMLNDDFTPMDFVVSLLQSLFDKTAQEATEIMLQIHRSGVGVCGIYTYEVAEMKAAQVIEIARRSQHPLRCEVEKV